METLGRYILTRKIASGGMADVYQAKLVGVEGFVKEVAIKKILPQWSHNPEFVEMLVDEAKVLLHLNHSNIVQVLEFNKQDEIYYLVMEYIHGLDLRSLLKFQSQNHIPLPIACFIILEISKGLKFAHQKKDSQGNSLGIVHRDISPQNILISFDGEVKLTDFGIAKARGKTNETAAGAIKGKFSYMSPEQATGSNIDHRSDIFSLGLVFFEILFGEKCFDADNDLLILDLVKEAQVDIPDYLDLPDEVNHILRRCLSKDIEHRYDSIDHLIDELQSYLFKDSQKVSVMDLIDLIDESVPKKMKSESLSTDTILHFPTVRAQVEETEQKTKVLVQNQEDDLTLLETPSLRTPLIKEKKKRWLKFLIFIFLLLFCLVIGKDYFYPPIQEKTIQLIRIPIEKPKPKIPVKLKKKEIIKPKSFQVSIDLKSQPDDANIKIKTFDTQSKKTNLYEVKGSFNQSWDIFEKMNFEVMIHHPQFHSKKNRYHLDQKNPVISEKIQLIPIKYGKIWVNARPWAHVSIDKVVNKVETPFRSHEIEVGTYRLKAEYPPSGRKAETKIQILENKTLKCQVNFLENHQFKCY